MSCTGLVVKRKNMEVPKTTIKKPSHLQAMFKETKSGDSMNTANQVHDSTRSSKSGNILAGLISNSPSQNPIGLPQASTSRHAPQPCLDQVKMWNVPGTSAIGNEDYKKRMLIMESGDEYEIIGRLGEGSYGKVYHVVRVKDANIYAAKIMKEKKKTSSSFQREKLIFDKIDRDPHITLLQCLHYDTLIASADGWPKDVLFTLVMGPSLRDVQGRAQMIRRGPDNATFRKVFSLCSISSIGIQIIEAMNHLEKLGVYHLDLKPHNILFAAEGDFDFDDLSSKVPQMTMRDHVVKITDYGVSRFYEEFTSPGSEYQTLNYRAPEVSLGLPYGKTTDVWSLGAILGEMYYGERLFCCELTQAKKEQEQSVFEDILSFIEKDPSPELLQKVKLHGRSRVDLSNIENRAGPPTSSFTLRTIKRDEEADELFNTLEKIFVINPKERPLFKDLFTHPFFHALHITEVNSPDLSLSS